MHVPAECQDYFFNIHSRDKTPWNNSTFLQKIKYIPFCTTALRGASSGCSFIGRVQKVVHVCVSCIMHTDNHGMNANRSNLIFSFDVRSLFPSLVCRNYGSINKFVVFARMHHHHSPSTFLSDSPLFYLSHLTSSSFHLPLYPRSCRHAFG